MKRFLVSNLFIGSFLLLVGSCTQADIIVAGGDPAGGKEEEGVALDVRSIGLTMEVEPMSKAIATGGPQEGNALTNPNALTAVGVCVTRTNTNGVLSNYSTTNRTQTFLYTADAWKQGEGEEPLLLYSDKGTVYAWAPTETGSVSLTGTPREPLLGSVRVMDKQTFVFPESESIVEWETNQKDYLYGTGTNANGDRVDRWHPEVSLVMRHALAKVSFRVMKGEGVANDTELSVKAVSLKTAANDFVIATSARMSLIDGTLKGTLKNTGLLTFTASGGMRLAVPYNPSFDGVPVHAFGLVAPVTGKAATLELTLDDGVNHALVFTMAPDSEGNPSVFTATWEGGKNYVYNIRIGTRGVEIADLTVEDWDAGNGPGQDITVQ